MITQAKLEALKPCKDRWANYLAHYSGREFTRRQFMGLRHITHKDKLWVAFRLMTEQQCRLVACDIAESVLHIYESQYPGDLRPRQSIEAARAYGLKPSEENRQRMAGAWDGAWAASRAAWAAVRAAAGDAAGAAAWAAAGAVAWAAVRAAAGAVAWAAAGDAAGDAQEKRIRTIVLNHWKDA